MTQVKIKIRLASAWMWCRQNFEKPNNKDIYALGLESGRSDHGKWAYLGNGLFEFRDERDATLFALRWS